METTQNESQIPSGAIRSLTGRYYARQFREDGFVVIPDVLTHELATYLAERISQCATSATAAAETHSASAHSKVRARDNQIYGIRDLLSIVPAVANLAKSPHLLSYVTPILGNGAFCIRGMFFDKTSGANWKVPWHQDTAIALREHPERRNSYTGFSPWSNKSGIPHVQPPEPYLSRRIALRLHLDPCGHDNGPLRVIPQSHMNGLLTDEQIDYAVSTVTPLELMVERGALISMHPLLLHASSPARSPVHRRVIHLEYAADQLPSGLVWHSSP